MKIQHNISLKAYNTFGIDVTAKTLISVSTEEELKSVLQKNYAEELFVLGGGSNMLLTKNIDATVLHINLKGKTVIEDNDSHVIVEVQAGENWHDFVLWTLEQDFGGVENLSLIPGNVGTAPIQNIGAYGVELKDSFLSCDALHIQTLEKNTFAKADCKFGYRTSIFKTSEKGNFIITSLRLRLTKKNHNLHTSYGSIQARLEEQSITQPTIQDISNAVISIRSSKLPNPEKLGNSGSFFKNPVIPLKVYKKLKEQHEAMPSYPVSKDFVKVPAGWLIDQCGFKGYRIGDAGVHEHQALVLVNYDTASGEDILGLAKTIQDKVLKIYSIQLEPEVNIIS